jgi:hypothetical protein
VKAEHLTRIQARNATLSAAETVPSDEYAVDVQAGVDCEGQRAVAVNCSGRRLRRPREVAFLFIVSERSRRARGCYQPPGIGRTSASGGTSN